MIRLLVAGALALSATTAGAQAACNGDLVAIRVSKLKPGGSMAGFAEAVRDHKAWYAAKGLKADKFATAPVYERTGGAYKASVTKVMTFHVYGAAAAPQPDEAWKAYVAKYRANADIDSEQRVCLPKGMLVIK